MNKTVRKWCYPALLVFAFGAMFLLSKSDEGVFGSTTDWFSQHAALAETIRDACLEQKTLLPFFLPLGGGSNGFQFSYYGYLRPDILLGCLLPGIPMLYILIGYMVAGWGCSVLLCYWWLAEDEGHRGTAFWGSMLFLLAACFFQSHRQVMFINYMPFLLAALLSIKKKKYGCTALFLVLIYVNSFYYSIAVLAALGWYWYREEGKKFLLPYMKAAACSIGMAAMLLIPTGLVLLEHRRKSESLMAGSIFSMRLDFSSLLYSPYGMGLTAVCLYGLIAGLGRKKRRADSIFYLLVSAAGLALYVLNGTLYVRSKILIPFVPLVILQCVRVFRELLRERAKWPLWPFVPLLGVAACYIGREKLSWIAADLAVLFCICILQRSTKYWRAGYMALLAVPCIFFLKTASTEQYVDVEQAEDFAFTEEVQQDFGLPDLMAAQVSSLKLAASDDSGTGELPFYDSGSLYRYDSLYEPLNTSNRDASGLTQKSTMYSSVTNQRYSEVYYNLLKTPIRINNRVALLMSDNPFLLQFMGVRFLKTRPDFIPDGYSVIAREDGRVIVENPNVLPIAYITQDSINEQTFEKQNSWGKLDALMRTTVVEGMSGDGKTEWKSEMKKQKVSFEPCSLPEGVIAEQREDGAYEVTVLKESSFSIELSEPVKDQVLLLEFKVKSRGTDAVMIDINGIRNKLSGSGAAYPNKNNTFHYQFSEEDGVSRLDLKLAKGKYRISGIKWHSYPKKLLTAKDYTEVEPHAVSGNEILSCSARVWEDGYFVTSVPRQRGMKLTIDGKQVPMITVNKAFAGAEIPVGEHEIRLTFSPPGLKAGYLISAAAACFFAVDFIIRRRKKGRNAKEAADGSKQNHEIE